MSFMTADIPGLSEVVSHTFRTKKLFWDVAPHAKPSENHSWDSELGTNLSTMKEWSPSTRVSVLELVAKK